MPLWMLLAVQASVGGVVRDAPSGAPLAGALVVLPDMGRTAVTDIEGRYALTGVAPGPQHVLVRLVGYAPRTFHALVPGQGRLEINVDLPPLPIELRAIEVAAAHAAVPIRGLDAADSTRFPDRSVSQGALRVHPLLAEPDLLPALAGGAALVEPESPSGLHVRGGASDQVAFLLDGIPVFSPYHSAGTTSAWNPDAVSRLDLVTSGSGDGFADALSGTVAATTRAPGAYHGAQGSVSTTQARLTIDGPLGASGAGYLVSVRSSFPGLALHPRDATYLSGEGGDRLAKVESPLLAGRLRLLGYDNENEIAAGARDPAAPRNAYAWDGRSLGGEWTKGAVRVRAWSAVAAASARWTDPDSGLVPLAAARRDDGVAAQLEVAGGERRTSIGARLQRTHTSYDGGALHLDVRAPTVAAFAQHERPVTSRGAMEMSIVATAAAGAVHVAPGARLQWRLSGGWTASGAFEGRQQFTQSLRNPESVVGAIFPVDLQVAAGTRGHGVPIARSNTGVAALEFRSQGGGGLRLGAQAYLRDFRGLALVAPHSIAPFATSDFVLGGGRARGVAIEAAANGARYGIVAGYGFQVVRLTYGDSSYVPAHGVTHTLDAGVIVFPSPSASLRLGVNGAVGRRATAVSGPFEWEACNLLDGGCEFAGSPGARAESLGATALPAYLRIDLGVRKHWHVKLAGREGLIAAFGTMTNVLGVRNVLTVVVDPATGERSEVTMRPRAPLVVGIDWRF